MKITMEIEEVYERIQGMIEDLMFDVVQCEIPEHIPMLEKQISVLEHAVEYLWMYSELRA